MKGLMKTRVPKLGQWRSPRACNFGFSRPTGITERSSLCFSSRIAPLRTIVYIPEDNIPVEGLKFESRRVVDWSSNL